MGHVSTSLKERIGEAAVVLSAAKTLLRHYTFPIEIRSSGNGKAEDLLWKGEALQVTAGNPLTTIEQIVSILLHRDPVHGRSEYFQGARFWIRVPGSVNLQLDGSRVKRKDCVSDEEQLRDPNVRSIEASSLREAKQLSAEQIAILKTKGRKVTVVAVGPNPEREGTWFVAGESADKKTGEGKPVAVRIDHDTTIVRATGEPLLSTFVAQLPEGSVVAVDGRKSKHGAIRAKRIVVVSE